MHSFYFDLFVRLLCLLMAIIAFMIARDYGLFRKQKKDEFTKAIIAIFASIAWAGLITFAGGAIKILFTEWDMHPTYQEWRLLIVRFFSVVPMLAAVINFYSYITKSQRTEFKIERTNGKAKGGVNEEFIKK